MTRLTSTLGFSRKSLAPWLLAFCSSAALAEQTAPHAALVPALQSLCGQAFAGIIERDNSADTRFAGKELVMHVRDCSTTSLAVPFHVGEDGSRIWRFSTTADGLLFQHDHRHVDGKPDQVTLYGGHSDASLSRFTAQGFIVAFPADEPSKTMFAAHGMAASQQNVWSIAIDSVKGQRPTVMRYQLHRPGREFIVRFDLTKPLKVPAPAWDLRL